MGPAQSTFMSAVYCTPGPAGRSSLSRPGSTSKVCSTLRAHPRLPPLPLPLLVSAALLEPHTYCTTQVYTAHRSFTSAIIEPQPHVHILTHVYCTFTCIYSCFSCCSLFRTVDLIFPSRLMASGNLIFYALFLPCLLLSPMFCPLMSL